MHSSAPGCVWSRICQVMERRLSERGALDRRSKSPGGAAMWLFVVGASVSAALLFSGCDDAPFEAMPTTEGEMYLEAALDLIETHSLHRFEINWPALRESVWSSAGSLQTSADAHAPIRYALELVGDDHSRLLTATDTAGSQTSLNERPVIREAPNDGGHPVLGYVRVPEATGPDISELATDYHRELEEVHSLGVCGWIVDLRGNFGGSMWPMIAGLGPLLGEGVLGYYLHPDSTRVPWAYEGGKALRDGSVVVEVADPFGPIDPSPPVAVLVDRATASSAEAVFISFFGRMRTRSIGARTAGFSTSNRAFVLSDGAILLITTSVMADREGRGYGGRVWPDTLVSGDGSLSIETDAAYRVGLEWLRSSVECGG